MEGRRVNAPPDLELGGHPMRYVRGESARMTRFLFFIDSLSTWVGKAFAWLILVLTLGVSYEVFVRYVLRAPTTWAFDFSYITYGALFLMAGAYTLSRNGHVRADVLYRLWQPRTQATMDLVLYILFFLPGGAGLDVFGLELRRDVGPVPRGQHLQPGRRAGLSAQGADPGHRRPAAAARHRRDHPLRALHPHRRMAAAAARRRGDRKHHPAGAAASRRAGRARSRRQKGA